MEWKFIHCHGDKPQNEETVEGDIISALKYDPTGQYLALGDRAGRITILERSKDGSQYNHFHQLQSHESEFDYLKSVEIEAKINQVCWLKKCNSSLMLLSANDKTIKLWKTHPGGRIKSDLPLAVSKYDKDMVTCKMRRTYSNAHAYHINSVSLNSDSETFISADDLRINMWHLGHDESVNIVDIKPANMEDLTEVLTAATFHPQSCNQLIYSTSKGSIKMGDLRESFMVRQYCKKFEIPEDLSQRTFFSEIIGSLSDITFSGDGRYILARDYLTLKVWDVHMEAKPVKVLSLHDGLRNRLCELYENDCIFDKFECQWSGNGNFVLTGSYKNHFKVGDAATLTGTTPTRKTSNPQILTFEASKPKKKTKLVMRKGGVQKPVKDDSYEAADFNSKVLHVCVHPTESEIAVAALNNVFVFAIA